MAGCVVPSDVARRVVRVHVAVPAAALRDVAEQRGGLALAGQPGELVDGGDDERRRQPVDLLVDGEDRQPLADLAALGERAAGQFVAAVDEHPAHAWRRP